MIKKTKIICAIGQQSANETTIEEMLLSGMNVARFNMNQGTIKTISSNIELIRKLSLIHNRTCSVMFDTNGPKTRTHSFKNINEPLSKNSPVTIYTAKEVIGTSNEFSITNPDFYFDVTIGDEIIVNANAPATLKVTSKNEINKTIECVVERSGEAAESCLVTVPGVKSSLPIINSDDSQILNLAVKMNVDFIGASYVRCAEDIREIKDYLSDLGNKKIKVFAKIENKVAYDNFDEILNAADGIIISRGDLSVEVSYELLPIILKRMIKKANTAGKPIGVSTQILSSMTRNKKPSRAEVSDVANLILDGVDDICLSNVTTIGKYPSKSVKECSKIIEVTEENAKELLTKVDSGNLLSMYNFDYSLDNAVANAVISTAKDVHAKLIVSFSESGATSKRISKHRPDCPIASVSSDESIRQSLTVNWGIYPIVVPHKLFELDFIETATEIAKSFGLEKGDTFIITGGNGIGNTNLMKVCKL